MKSANQFRVLSDSVSVDVLNDIRGKGSRVPIETRTQRKTVITPSIARSLEKDSKPPRSDKDVIEESLCVFSEGGKLGEISFPMRRNVLPVSWANVVKREGHALKPRSASRLEFIAPKDPGRPEVIEIEEQFPTNSFREIPVDDFRVGKGYDNVKGISSNSESDSSASEWIRVRKRRNMTSKRQEKREVQEKTTTLSDSTVQPDGPRNLPRQGIKQSRPQGFARSTVQTQLSSRFVPQHCVPTHVQPGVLPAELACSTHPQSPASQASLFIKAIKGSGKRGHGSIC
ncbi:hypothetical protein U1Q18_036374 [Sarracenia purpurea var. burkii]